MQRTLHYLVYLEIRKNEINDNLPKWLAVV